MPLNQDELSRILGSTMLPSGAVHFGGFVLLPTSIAAIQTLEKVRRESADDDAPAGDVIEEDGNDD